jgi:hypothetical protein
MTKFKTKNGWTKERMIAQIRKYNDGTRALDEFGTCRYQTSSGNRCAVGCFIHDGHEGLRSRRALYGLLADHPDLNDVIPLDYSALSKMQSIHDDEDGKGDVRDRLESWINKNVEDA